MNNNAMVHQSKLHWILFFWPAVLLGLVGYVAINFPIAYQASVIVGVVLLVWVGMIWMTYQFSSLTIKRKQVILRTGFVVRQTIDIPLNKIESIDIRQSLLGSVLKYGSLVITGTGGTRQVIHYVKQPLTCRRHIEQLMHHSV